MQTPAQAQQTVLTSDYKIDKVVFKQALSQFVPHAASMSDAIVITIPHGLPFKPLMIGTYSEDNFATSYEFSNSPYFFNPSYMFYSQRLGAVVSSDATNIYIEAVNFDTGRAFQFRVVGLAPSNYVPPTTAAGTARTSGLMFNSDDNYMKIYQEGILDINDSGAFGLTDYTVTHGLGYVPNALVFSEWGGVVRQIGSENAIGVAGVEAYCWLTTATLVMSVDPYFAGLLRLHYRIYLDG